MSDETALTALFDTVDIGTPPPAPPDLPRRLLRLGRRSVRRRRLAGVLAVAAVLVVATVAVPPAVRYLDSDRPPLQTGQDTGRATARTLSRRPPRPQRYSGPPAGCPTIHGRG